MSDKRAMDLYELLPALYRLRDAEQGYPLRAFLEIIAEQVDIVKQDIDGLRDNFFVETCAEWAIPYIGDLVGNDPLHEVIESRRADVAKTVYYRRRKGTLPMLEELARDVTGWGGHAVACFELLSWTQNLNHRRFQMAANPQNRNPNAVDRVGSVNLRNLDGLDRLDGPFDSIAHTVDVRPAGQFKGWYNLHKIGFFLWRLKSYWVTRAAPRKAIGIPYGYTFSPMGNLAPLFNNAQREADETRLASEIHVPGPIRPLALYFDLKHAREAVARGQKAQSAYAGPGLSFSIKLVKTDETEPKERIVPPEAIVCMDLEKWEQPPATLKYKEKQPDGVTVVEKPIQVGIDVRRGRFAFAENQGPETNERVEVSYHYGFSGDIGGGPYSRLQSLATPTSETLLIEVTKATTSESGETVDTIQKAIKKWIEDEEKRLSCIIRITDSGIYGGNLDIQLPKLGRLVIEAGNNMRPSVRLVGISSINVSGEAARLTLNGLLIEGGLELSDALDLRIKHCTLVPGRMLNKDGLPAYPDRDSLVVKKSSGNLAITIDKSIIGPVRMPADCERLTIRDSIVQALVVDGDYRPAIAANDAGTRPGPPTTLERVTIWGPVYVKELTLASEVIFNSPVEVQQRQTGCVRFSYVPKQSRPPRCYRCQPDLALEERTKELGRNLSGTEQLLIRSRLQPTFTSTHYGDPYYAQLGSACAEEIYTGAENGSEIGAFSSLKQPQRATNLRIRLEEYLPFGLEAGLIYVT
jgi:hypothetical protein